MAEPGVIPLMTRYDDLEAQQTAADTDRPAEEEQRTTGDAHSGSEQTASIDSDDILEEEQRTARENDASAEAEQSMAGDGRGGPDRRTSIGSDSGSDDGQWDLPSEPRRVGPPLLTSLPFTLQREVFSHLHHPAAIALRQTCTLFRTNFTAADTAAKAVAYRKRLIRRDNDTYPAPCYDCLRLLPILKFDSTQPGPPPWGEEFPARYRRCIDCVLASNDLTLGACFWRNQTELVLCRRCVQVGPTEGRHYTPRIETFCIRCARRAFWPKAVRAVTGFQTTLFVASGLVEAALALGIICVVSVRWRQHGQPPDLRLVGWSVALSIIALLCNLFATPLIIFDALFQATSSGKLSESPELLRLRTRFRKASVKVSLSVICGFTFVTVFLLLIVSICLIFTIQHLESLLIVGLLVLMALQSTINWVFRATLVHTDKSDRVQREAM